MMRDSLLKCLLATMEHFSIVSYLEFSYLLWYCEGVIDFRKRHPAPQLYYLADQL